MIEFNLNFEEKSKITTKHVLDFLNDDGDKILDYFPEFYFNYIYKIFYKVIKTYNNLDKKEKSYFARVVSTHYKPKNHNDQNLFCYFHRF